MFDLLSRRDVNRFARLYANMRDHLRESPGEEASA